jgi:hypothetical protein
VAALAQPAMTAAAAMAARTLSDAGRALWRTPVFAWVRFFQPSHHVARITVIRGCLDRGFEGLADVVLLSLPDAIDEEL